MTSKSRIIANSGRYVEADGSPKFGSNVTLTTVDGQVSAVVSRDSGQAAVANYSSIDSLPISNLITGTIAFVEDINAIYVTDGSGWFSIATVNKTPVVYDGVGDILALSTDGTPTTVTITAVDSEGIPLVYTATPDSNFAGLATISQDSSVFTITPLSEDSATTTSATVTFSVSDGVNVAGGVNTFTLNFRSDYWKDVVLSTGTSATNGLTNSTFVDRSTNAHTVTPTGTPIQTAFHPYLDNWSVLVNSTSDYLLLNETVSVGTSDDFTFEWFINTNGGLSVYGRPCELNNDLSVEWTGSNFGTLNTKSGQVLGMSHTYTHGDWHHYAIVRSSGTIRVYFNGTQIGSIADSQTYNFGYVGIGAKSSGGGPIGGTATYISNVRAIVGTALYTTTFTPPTEKLTAITGTSLVAAQSNRFVDNSSNGFVFTPTGAPKVSAFNPFGQESEYASGENKGAVLINQGSLSTPTVVPATNDFTIECWIYPTDVTAGLSGTQGIFGQYVNGSSGAFLLYMINGVLRGFTATETILSNITFKNNTWYHIALVRSSTTDTLYVDGVAVDSGYLGSVLQTNALIGFFIVESRDYYFRGNIADLKVSSTAVYTANFTPPTAPLTNTNATLYLPFDNAGIFDKTGNSRLTLVGNTVTSTTQTKYAATSMYFDGTGDGASIATDSKFIYGTGDFTIECWVYLNASGTFGVFGHGDGSTANLYLYINGTTPSVFFINQTIATGPSLSTGTWTHLAVTRTNNTLKVFTNGVSGTAVTNTTDLIASGPITIGMASNNTQVLNGYIENLQVLKGFSKYVLDFTPPAQTQGLVYQATGLPLNTPATAVTNLATFEATSPQAGFYYIQPTGASSPATVEYSGTDFKGSGKGYFRWWRSVDAQAPTVNHYGLSWQFDEMLVDLEGVEYQDVIFNTNQTFNQRNSTGVADGGSRAGYRVYFGYAGGHGIYNTSQTPCNWGASTGAIGAGYDGSCGTFPNDLRMGTGTASNTYANRGNTISFWFRW